MAVDPCQVSESPWRLVPTSWFGARLPHAPVKAVLHHSENGPPSGACIRLSCSSSVLFLAAERTFGNRVSLREHCLSRKRLGTLARQILASL